VTGVQPQPFVSCIMPTRNRRRFLSQAIWYFLRQDYRNREIIIVDDGEDCVQDNIPRDPRIHYIRLPARASIGAKRNIACEISQGELIAHWDDDDWIGPERLTRQVESLLGADAAVCGVTGALHYELERGSAWIRRDGGETGPPGGILPPCGPVVIAGGTILYRRSAWLAHPFADRDSGEDSAFIGEFAHERIETIENPGWYVTLLHGGSTSAVNLSDPAWERRPIAEVEARLGLDRSFYAKLRHGQVAHQQTASAGVPRVALAATFLTYDGYGSMAEYLALGMSRCGGALDVLPFHIDHQGLSAEFEHLLASSSSDPSGPVLCFAWWGQDLHRFRGCQDLFINTMWETSLLPRDWPARLNRARAVIVPSRFVGRTFRESGVEVPIEVVRQGIDPAVYHYEERPDRPGLTTLMVGVFVPRKNVHEGIAAWMRAFAGDPQARLIIKARFGWGSYVPDDPRVSFVDTNEPTRGIARWYHDADVLLALGNEGFGLPLVEAMATGLPVIALSSEGQGDVCEDAPGALLPVPPVRFVPVDEPPYGPCGVRGVPSVDDVAERLRWVADHRDEARAVGRAAAAWVLANRNVWDMGPAMLAAMERHLRVPTPLRAVHRVWAPAGSGPAALAARALGEALGSVEVVAGPPDLRGLRVLHVQHEPGWIEDGDLTRYVQQARHAGVLVAVTEHVVGEHARPWEREADVLVAGTPGEGEVLRQRWPGARVQVLASGSAGANGWEQAAREHLALWTELESR
jgi:glycosyltransferase involved in cell wall biosynthesis